MRLFLPGDRVRDRGRGRSASAIGVVVCYDSSSDGGGLMTPVLVRWSPNTETWCNPANLVHVDEVRSGLPETLAELAPLAERIAKGRAKYPNGCTVLSLIDEVGEVAHAINKYESEERVRDELLDVAAVAMRLYLGEIDRGLGFDGLRQVRASLKEEPE